MNRLSFRVQVAVMVGLMMFVGTFAKFGHAQAPDEPTRDRGDVPGWVMITMMTSIVVIALLVVFREAVTKAVQDAFNAIVG